MSKVKDSWDSQRAPSLAVRGGGALFARFSKPVPGPSDPVDPLHSISNQGLVRSRTLLTGTRARISSGAPKSRICPAHSDFRRSTFDLRLGVLSSIRRFEDVFGWQRSRKLVREVYRASASGAFAKDFGLRDQIRRASDSVFSNIAEGFERGSDREFAQFLTKAKGSVGEGRRQLYVALDQGSLSEKQFEELAERSAEGGLLLSGLICHLQKADLKGPNPNSFRRS